MKRIKIIAVLIIMILSACAPSHNVDTPTQNLTEPKEYDLLQRLDATGIEAVRYIDNENIYISACNKEKPSDPRRRELILARYNLKSDEISIFYRDFESTDYMRNISVHKLSSEKEVVFNGAAIFFLDGNKLINSVILDEAYRRDAYYNSVENSIAFISQESKDLYYLSDGFDEPKLIYELTPDMEKLGARMTYDPVINPAGNKILFQLVGDSSLSAYNLACYNIETSELDFNVEINQRLEVINSMWLNDDTFFTWEASNQDRGLAYITIYSASGEVQKEYSINMAIMQIQTDQNDSAAQSALIYGIDDEKTNESIFSIAILDIAAGKAKNIYNSDTVIFSQDISPNAEKIVWCEGTMIYEMSTNIPAIKNYDISDIKP